MVRLSQALGKWIDFPLNHPVISIVVRTHIFNNVICFLKFFFLHLGCHSEDVLSIWGANTEAQAHI